MTTHRTERKVGAEKKVEAWFVLKDKKPLRFRYMVFEFEETMLRHDVVPCTITYSFPTKKRSSKK